MITEACSYLAYCLPEVGVSFIHNLIETILLLDHLSQLDTIHAYIILTYADENNDTPKVVTFDIQLNTVFVKGIDNG